MKTAYLIIEENSPELVVENEFYEIIGLYATREAATDKISDIIYDSKSENYFLVDDLVTGNGGHEWTLYYKGEEDSGMWYTIKLIPIKIED